MDQAENLRNIIKKQNLKNITNSRVIAVTSGKGGKTLWIARNTELSELNTAWKNLLESVQEIEDLLKIPLDIEFAVNKKK